MFGLNGRCNFFNVRTQENRPVEFTGEASLKEAYPQQEYIAISSGPLAGLPLLGANAWEITCFSSDREKLGGFFGTGSFGTVLKCAGFDRVVISGTCPKPSYVLIDEEGCQVREYDDFSAWQPFERHIKGIAGDSPYGILLHNHEGFVTQGLFKADEAIGDFLKRHQIGAIVVIGRGSIPLAQPERLLAKSLEIGNRWRATGLEGGTGGCFACHGRCSSLMDDDTGVMPKEQKELFIGLGICPQVVLQGAIMTVTDLLEVLYCCTGKKYAEQELWDYSRVRGGIFDEC